MQLEDYTTGTVSIANGSATLTGTGTAWDVAGFKAGDTFHSQGLVGIIASVDSDTAITLRDVWAGTSIVGGAYLLRYQPDNSRMQGTTRQLLDQLRAGIWLTPDATGKTADKSTYDDRPAGFRFLDVSVDPFKLYVKESDTSADWSSGADWVGPQGQPGADGSPDGGRPVLTAARTYYVRTDGSDSNNGLSDTSGGAFLTLQKALIAVGLIDFNGQNVTIEIAAGTYSTIGSNNLQNTVGQAGVYSLIIKGATGNKADVIVEVENGACFSLSSYLQQAIVQDLSIRNKAGSTSGLGFSVINGAIVYYRNVDFGTAVTHHKYIFSGGVCQAIGDYSISGGGLTHIAAYGGTDTIQNRTITITGTPDFSSTFALASGNESSVVFQSCTFVGQATGQRYNAAGGGVIRTFQPADFLPGDAAGAGTNFGVSPYGLYQ